MLDKKPTDTEIIKALECCISSECDNCPYDEQTACKEYLLQDAINKINHLQAENKIKQDRCLELLNLTHKYRDKLQTAKAEAYKEFAERLKMSVINRYNEYDNQEYPYATIGHIDNLLKELVGEDNA